MRGIILIPWAVPTIVNANLWKWIFNANAGILNKVLLKLHLIDENIVWLGSGKLAINMIILSDTWKMLPLVIIMLLAGLQTVSNDAKEASIIDGANAWQRFKVVYFPALKPMYIVVLVLRTIQTIRVFDIVYSLTSGGPNDSTQVVSCYIVIEPSLPESRKNGGLRYESNGKEKNRKDIIIFGSDIIGSLDAIANYLDVYIQYHIRK